MQKNNGSLGHRKHRQVPREAHKKGKPLPQKDKETLLDRAFNRVLQDSAKVETVINPFTLGKEKAATNLVKIINKIVDPQNRWHVLKWTQTVLSRFGRGLNAIRPIANCHVRGHLAVLWRKYYIDVIDKKASIPLQVKSHMQSIIHARVREVIRESVEAIAADKEAQRKSAGENK